jgi:uncharacterized protein YaaW (UPF0174 family)
MKSKNKQTLENAYQSIINESINTVFLVWKGSEFDTHHLLSVCANEDIAKKEMNKQIIKEIQNTNWNALPPMSQEKKIKIASEKFYYEEVPFVS